MKNGSATCGSAGTSHSARQSLSTTPTGSVVANAMVAGGNEDGSAGSSTLRVNSSAMTIQVERAHRCVCAQVATRVVSELCQMPCETPTNESLFLRCPSSEARPHIYFNIPRQPTTTPNSEGGGSSRRSRK
jgi:hypothetical protein